MRRVVGAFASGPSLEALASFAELPDALRARVRARTEAPEVALVDEVLAGSPAEKPRAAAEDALERAARATLSALAGRLREGREARQALHDAETRAAVRKALRLAVSEEPGPADELADLVRVVDEEMGLVDLDLETNEVVRSVSLAGARPPSSVVEETLPHPSSDLLWLEVTDGPNREPCSYLVDVVSGRGRSKFPFDPSPSVVFREGASVLVTADEQRARLLTLDGLPAAGDLPPLP